jgi:dolichol-phosphate mannosyltransferase
MSADRKRALAIIVCYNNGANVAKVVERISPIEEREHDVLFVDDGSSDETSGTIRSSGHKAIFHDSNRGLGAAIKSGVRYAEEHGYEAVCILAGNDKDDPRQIDRVLEPILHGDASYVQGSRFARGGEEVNTPLFRKAMVRVHAAFFGAITGRSCTDALNGFRAYRLSLFRGGDIDIWQEWLDTYEYETYLHYRVLRGKHVYREVGVSKRYPPPQTKQKYSHIRPGIDWWKILRPIPLLMLRIRK